MRFRKKPVEVDAERFDSVQSAHKLIAWIGGSKPATLSGNKLLIPTLEGVMQASIGDWIIQGVNGEYYPCKPDIFQKTYEEVE